MRKHPFAFAKNKGADYLDGDRADQRLCFCFIDGTMPLPS